MIVGSDKISDDLHFPWSKCRTFVNYNVTVVAGTKFGSSPAYIYWGPLIFFKAQKLVQMKCEDNWEHTDKSTLKVSLMSEDFPEPRYNEICMLRLRPV